MKAENWGAFVVPTSLLKCLLKQKSEIPDQVLGLDWKKVKSAVEPDLYGETKIVYYFEAEEKAFGTKVTAKMVLSEQAAILTVQREPNHK